MPRPPNGERLPQHVLDSAARLDRLAEAMAADQGPRVFLQDDVADKYSFTATPDIDCENRVALCKAACCRLTFPLSQQDIEEEIVAWNPQQPFLNAQDAEGYCVHLERQGCRCAIYAQRPTPCRAFDCRNDRRIWIDFEKRTPNPALDALEWPRNLGGDFNAHTEPPVSFDEGQPRGADVAAAKRSRRIPSHRIREEPRQPRAESEDHGQSHANRKLPSRD